MSPINKTNNERLRLGSLFEVAPEAQKVFEIRHFRFFYFRSFFRSFEKLRKSILGIFGHFGAPRVAPEKVRGRAEGAFFAVHNGKISKISIIK